MKIVAVVFLCAVSITATADSPYDMNEIANDPELALSAYLYEQSPEHSQHSGGGMGIEGTDRSIAFTTGAKRREDGIDMYALCGFITDGELDDELHAPLRAECEERLLRTIKKLSQPAEPGPYRAAGASEITWQSRVVTLITSDIAYVVEGHYLSDQQFTPCLRISDCCSTNGALYLDSCREPTEAEWKAIDYCQAKGLGCRSPDYMACLREQDIKAGCEPQPDGSRLCY
ncbi:MAG: hypothetical protein ACR2QX_08330 [Woeseiaceae bacterium]